MKNIRYIIALLVAVLTFGTTQAENLKIQRTRQSKDPWQVMQTILYNHNVDTTGLSVESPIDSVLLFEILPDLKKAYHVDKESAYLSHSTMLGEVICSFMRVKYAGCKGETYDYYKLRYSPRQLFVYYLNKYPESPYAEEMRLKMECIDQSRAWRRCESMDDYYEVYSVYDVSYCPYSGFSNIAKRNNALRENMALFEDYYSSLGNDKYNLEDALDDNINFNLIAPYGKLGHSIFFLGNSGIASPISVSFEGPMVVSVVLEPGQYGWVELENGEYKIKITASDGNESWPYGNEAVTIEDGIYAASWYEYYGLASQTITFVRLDNYDRKAINEMSFIVIQRVVDELSTFSKLDCETSRTLLTHYLQKLYSNIKDAKEMDEIYKDYVDEEKIGNTINNLLEMYRSAEAGYRERIEMERFGF